MQSSHLLNPTISHTTYTLVCYIYYNKEKILMLLLTKNIIDIYTKFNSLCCIVVQVFSKA